MLQASAEYPKYLMHIWDNRVLQGRGTRKQVTNPKTLEEELPRSPSVGDECVPNTYFSFEIGSLSLRLDGTASL